VSTSEIPAVGLREPCPCGSGKRYKNCHARDRDKEANALVVRPFEGLACEAQLVMMTEFLSSATAVLPLVSKQAVVPKGVTVTIGTLLPNAYRGVRTAKNSIVLGMQNTFNSNDRSRDVADAIEILVDANPQEYADCQTSLDPGLRLQDFIDPTALLEVQSLDDFSWWLETNVVEGFEVTDLDELNSSVITADLIDGVPAAYLVHLADRPQVRMSLPYAEDAATDAWARLAATHQESLGEGTKLLGNFRVHGILTPVWDIATENVADIAEEVRAFAQRFAAAVADISELTTDQRRSRAAVVGKHVTIRK